jgi:hypothetical protein
LYQIFVNKLTNHDIYNAMVRIKETRQYYERKNGMKCKLYNVKLLWNLIKTHAVEI